MSRLKGAELWELWRVRVCQFRPESEPEFRSGLRRLAGCRVVFLSEQRPIGERLWRSGGQGGKGTFYLLLKGGKGTFYLLLKVQCPLSTPFRLPNVPFRLPPFDFPWLASRIRSMAIARNRTRTALEPVARLANC